MKAASAKKVLQSIARGFVQVNPIYEARKIEDAISKVDVVSFDVFDTLLKRDLLKPADVFLAVKALSETRGVIVPSEYVESRCAAERDAYADSEGEIRLEDIYSHMTGDASTLSAIMQAEMDCELLFSNANDPIKHMFDLALTLGKRVVLISDMYLPKFLVEEMLEKNDYRGFEELFLSSEVGVQKISGKLYGFVSDKLGVKPSNVLHIGDTIRADYTAARRSGFNAVLIPRAPYLPKHKMNWYGQENALMRSVMEAISQNLSMGKSYYYRFGVEALGPLLVGLSTFIREDMIKRGLNRIHFIARDGYILKLAFEKLYGTEEIETNYLYGSRRSICVPSIYTRDDLIEVAPTTRLIDVVEFLVAVGVDRESAPNISLEAGYSKGECITKLESLNDLRFKKLIDLAFPLVSETSALERPKVVSYLQQECLNEDSAVFDLGWAGNIQGCMNRLLDKELGLPNIHGYYLGLDHRKARPDISCSSFLGYDYPSMYLQIVELCFSSQEGTTKGFEVSSDGVVKPILAEYEFDGRQEQKAILEVQKGGLDYVSRCTAYKDFVSFSCFPNTSFSVMKGFGTKPNCEDAEIFGNFSFEDNGSCEKLASPGSLASYAIHPKKLKSDFARSMWKVGFSKQLLKAPLPYYKILTALKSGQSKNYR